MDQFWTVPTVTFTSNHGEPLSEADRLLTTPNQTSQLS